MFSPEAQSHIVPRTRNNENQINSSSQNAPSFVLHKKLNNSTTTLNSNSITSDLSSITFLNVQNSGIKRELELTPNNNTNGILNSSKVNTLRPSKQSKADLYSPIANSTGISNTTDPRTLENQKNEQIQTKPTELFSKNLDAQNLTNGEVNKCLNNENVLVETSKLSSNIENAKKNDNTQNSLIENIIPKGQENFLNQVDQKIQKVMWDIEDNHDRMMSENYKFKLEMFKEFMSLKQEINDSIKQHSINEALLSEVIRLKEENKRLKKLF